MPMIRCSSGRHEFRDHEAELARNCCQQYQLTETHDQLILRRADAAGKLRLGEEKRTAIRKEMDRLGKIRSDIADKLAAYSGARQKALLAGMTPLFDSGAPTTANIQAVDEALDAKQGELEIQVRDVAAIGETLAGIEGELARFDKHERLKKAHAGMLAVVLAWNAGAEEIAKLWQESGTPLRGTNHGEFPLFPVEMAPSANVPFLRIHGMFPE